MHRKIKSRLCVLLADIMKFMKLIGKFELFQLSLSEPICVHLWPIPETSLAPGPTGEPGCVDRRDARSTMPKRLYRRQGTHCPVPPCDIFMQKLLTRSWHRSICLPLRCRGHLMGSCRQGGLRRRSNYQRGLSAPFGMSGPWQARIQDAVPGSNSFISSR